MEKTPGCNSAPSILWSYALKKKNNLSPHVKMCKAVGAAFRNTAARIRSG